MPTPYEKQWEGKEKIKVNHILIGKSYCQTFHWKLSPK